VIGTASAPPQRIPEDHRWSIEVVDYTQGDWAARVTNVDAVFGHRGGADGAKALGTLKKGGQFAACNENGEPSRSHATPQVICGRAAARTARRSTERTCWTKWAGWRMKAS